MARTLATLALLLPQALWGLDASVLERWGKVRGSSIAERLESASAQFLGLPFIDSPLGEGPEGTFDQGPLYRFDAFDCTTFVETVMALALAPKAHAFERTMNEIRYHNGKVAFENRNHFPCVDWIPRNTQAGRLVDITKDVSAGRPLSEAQAPISKRGWFLALSENNLRVPLRSETEKRSLLAKLHALGQTLPNETPSIPYIPLEAILTRNPIPESELSLRAEQEKELEKAKRQELGEQNTLEETEKKVHDAVIELRLKQLIQDTQVDLAFLRTIPSATLLNVVRPGWKIAGTLMNISHQGLVIQKKDGTYFRHVSKTGGRGKDVLLANYLRLCLLIPAIRGINLQKIQDTGNKSNL
jgi:hypothetical protein